MASPLAHTFSPMMAQIRLELPHLSAHGVSHATLSAKELLHLQPLQLRPQVIAIEQGGLPGLGQHFRHI